MDDINQVFLVGRLTRDSEIKYTAGGTAVCRFSLALGRSIKKGEKWEKETSFFDCTLWGKPAESMAKYLVKGKQVAIVGELRQERWEKDGQKFSKVGITVDTIQLVGGQKAEGEGAKMAPQPEGVANHGFEDDEIPF